MPSTFTVTDVRNNKKLKHPSELNMPSKPLNREPTQTETDNLIEKLGKSHFSLYFFTHMLVSEAGEQAWMHISKHHAGNKKRLQDVKGRHDDLQQDVETLLREKAMAADKDPKKLTSHINQEGKKIKITLSQKFFIQTKGVRKQLSELRMFDCSTDNPGYFCAVANPLKNAPKP